MAYTSGELGQIFDREEEDNELLKEVLEERAAQGPLDRADQAFLDHLAWENCKQSMMDVEDSQFKGEIEERVHGEPGGRPCGDESEEDEVKGGHEIEISSDVGSAAWAPFWVIDVGCQTETGVSDVGCQTENKNEDAEGCQTENKNEDAEGGPERPEGSPQRRGRPRAPERKNKGKGKGKDSVIKNRIKVKPKATAKIKDETENKNEDAEGGPERPEGSPERRGRLRAPEGGPERPERGPECKDPLYSFVPMGCVWRLIRKKPKMIKIHKGVTMIKIFKKPMKINITMFKKPKMINIVA